MNHSDVLREGREKLLTALRPLVHGATRVALLDFPAHSNVGDSAIWLGALAALRDIGLPEPAYTCDADTYERDILARAVGDGVILFTGGGSFGDLWERHLLFRERVVADFPGNRIIQLPESVHFDKPASLARATTTFNAHPDVTIMTRDAQSFEFVGAHFKATTVLAPDMAMALGSLIKTREEERDVLWLKRADKEDRWSGADVPPADATRGVTDWIAEPRSDLIAFTDHVRRVSLRHRWARSMARRVLQATRSRLAAHRLARGTDLLSSGRVVVTDRLHGHIVSCLLGIPHVVLDNSYGKLHRYVAQWTYHSPLVRTAHTPHEAHVAAQELLEAHGG